MAIQPLPFWSLAPQALVEQLQASAEGLTSAEAEKRLQVYGANVLSRKKRYDAAALLAGQFKSPIVLILIFAALLSFFLRDSIDALIILAIVILSGLLGFWQERGAATAVEKLLALVSVKALAMRNGIATELPLEDIVRGDIVLLGAGDSIPGDCLILQSKDLFVDEAALTSETYPERRVAAYYR